ncbi:MAG: hypothetical protein HY459_03535 [Parcubacteria group bacterium]|nr:hypothetical protein [Parcubacteria group bacterium]
MIYPYEVLLISIAMAKNVCETAHALKIPWLKKHGYFEDWTSGSITWTSNWGDQSSIRMIADVTGFPRIRLIYTHTSSWDEKTDLDYQFELASTPCHFGGKRYWFVCPLVRNGAYCRRRVGVLYIAGKYAGCRRCYDLAYQSQQESRGGRYGSLLDAVFGADKLEEKEMAMRTRFWKGQPTKRYARLLRKAGRIGRRGAVAMQIWEENKGKWF